MEANNFNEKESVTLYQVFFLLVLGIISFSFSILLGFDFSRSVAFSLILLILILCFKNPVIGLLFLIGSIPYSGMLAFSGVIRTGNKLFAIVVLLAFLTHFFLKKMKICPIYSKTFVVFSLITVLNLVFCFNAENPSGVLIFMQVNLSLLGLIFLISYVPQKKIHLKMIFVGATIGAALLGGYVGLFGMENMVGKYGSRLSAGTNSNVLAHALGVCFFLSLYLYSNTRPLTKIIILAADFLILFAIALTGSRGIWVALLISVIITAILMPKMKLKKKLTYLVSFSAVLGAIWFSFAIGFFGKYGGYLQRRISEVEFTKEASSGRMDFIWPYWIDRIMEKPLLGGGTGFTHIERLSTHNDILDMLVSHGILGLILLVFLFAMMIADIRTISCVWEKMVSFGLILFLFIAGITHTTLYFKSFAVALGIISALAIAQEKALAESSNCIAGEQWNSSRI